MRDEKLEELAKLEVEHREHEVAISDIRRRTFVQELTIFTGVYSDDNMLKYLLGPSITLLNPAACYAVVTSGLLNSWYVGSAIILSGTSRDLHVTSDQHKLDILGLIRLSGGCLAPFSLP